MTSPTTGGGMIAAALPMWHVVLLRHSPGLAWPGTPSFLTPHSSLLTGIDQAAVGTDPRVLVDDRPLDNRVGAYAEGHLHGNRGDQV